MQRERGIFSQEDSLKIVLVFGCNTNPYSERYANDDGNADHHNDCCAFTAAQERTATGVLVGDSLIRCSAGFVATRFEIGSHC